MQDYEQERILKNLRSKSDSPIQGKSINGIPNSAIEDVFAGKRRATSDMMGHSQNLAPSIAAKMSRAFGMDLTGMQVYRSDAMKGTGMQGVAQGNKVILSSDVDLNTTAGQAVLGHEISHIRAQSMGVGTGHSGLYEDAALEHQADTEGLLAAQGRSIYQSGMDTGMGMTYGLGMQGVEGLTPLSGGLGATAAAPMQAKTKDKKEEKEKEELKAQTERVFGMKNTFQSVVESTSQEMQDDILNNNEEVIKKLKNAKYYDLPPTDMGKKSYASLQDYESDVNAEKQLIIKWIQANYYYCYKENAMDDKIKPALRDRKNKIYQRFLDAEKNGTSLFAFEFSGKASDYVEFDLDRNFARAVLTVLPVAASGNMKALVGGKKG